MEVNNITNYPRSPENINTAEKRLVEGQRTETPASSHSTAPAASLPAEGLSAASLTKEILLSLGLSFTAETAAAVETLMHNNQTVNKENLRKTVLLEKFFAGEGSTPEEVAGKTSFMLKNNMPLENGPILTRFLNEGTALTEKLSNLYDMIDNLPNSPAKLELKTLFFHETIEKEGEAAPENPVAEQEKDLKTSENTHDVIPKTSQEPQPANILQKSNPVKENTQKEGMTEYSKSAGDTISLEKESLPQEFLNEDVKTFKYAEEKAASHKQHVKDILPVLEKSKGPEEVETLLNTLKDKLEKAVEICKRENLPEIEKAAENLKSDIKFIDDIKTCVYMPIPFNTPQGLQEGELYVFRDKRKKSKGDTASALLALNTFNLGRVEAYIQKTGNDLNLQFRLEDREIERLVQMNTPILRDMLSMYNIRSLSVVSAQTPFSLMDTPSQPQKGDIGGLKLDIKA